ncbi:MAG: non-ribosomal peptide synthetase, partial [Pricia sp.]
FMLEDSGAKFLITTKDLSTSFPSEPSYLVIEDIKSAIAESPTTPLGLPVSKSSIVYLLYTSGSTGRPKGVPVSHGNLVNLLFSMANEPGIEKNDKLLSITTISFDIAGVELFLPLLKGATLVLADEETARDGRLLLELLQAEDISILQATPTTWQMLLDSGWKEPLALKAFCGGEALPPQLAQQLLARCGELWNMYGPTEATIYSIIKKICAEDETITIGRPIANVQVYIVQDNNRLTAPGTIGEICIAGDGVALGYWKRPDLTAEKFINNPFAKGRQDTVLYRTGDLGRLLKNGEIECLGRIDQQVKIRGHRIELGEIEHALTLLDGVQAAVVLADSDYLSAHVVPSHGINVGSDLINQWRRALQDKLPPHLIPHKFHLLEKLPTTLNGKLDRKALSASQSSKKTKAVYTEPRNPLERMVAQIWEKCLGLNQMDIFSNFFEMGGHSLIAVRVMTLLEEKTGKRLPLSALFEYSTVEKLAQLLETDSQIITWDSLVPIKPNGNKIPLYIVHGAGLNVLVFNSLAQNMDEDQPVYGLQAKGINNKNKEYGTIEKMATNYVDAIIKKNPEGPYALAGYSFGGVIAFEMAYQLIERGKKVSMLGLLDTFVDPHLYYASPFRKKLASMEKRTRRRLHYLREMGKSWENVKHHLYRKKEYLMAKYVTRKKAKISGNELTKNQIMDLEMISDHIMRNYHLVPRNLEVDLFRAKNGTAYSHDPIHLGWKKIALEGVRLHKIPGDHDTIFSSSNVQKFAEILQDALDQKHSEF